jgi:hypothetical protein
MDELRLLWATLEEQRIRGVWWPRSHNLATEVTALLPAADAYLGAPMTRVSLNPHGWERQPRRLYAGRRVIRIGWFHSIDAGIVAIGATPTERITLCVVPPEWSTAAGRKLFDALSELEAWPTEADQLLECGGTDSGTGLR